MLRFIFGLIKFLFFLIICAGIAFASVVLVDAGDFQIVWSDYTITAPIWLLAAAGVAVLIIVLALYAFVFFLASIPAINRRSKHRIGNKALTRGLCAIAAGDAKAANRYCNKVVKCLPEDNGLGLLLQAQTARINGREEDSIKHFEKLLEYKDTKIFGLRGLIKTALDENNNAKALELSKQAAKISPHGSWPSKLVYDLLIKTGQWDEVYKMAASVLDKKNATSDRIAIDMMRSYDCQNPAMQLKKALKANGGFTPAACDLANFYIKSKKRTSAVNVLQKAWQENPHPELLEIWLAIAPKGKAGAPVSWTTRLVKKNPDNIESLIALSNASKTAGLWGQARKYIQDALEISKTTREFSSAMEIEISAGASEDIIQDLRHKAASAAPSNAWVCGQTGRIYESWHPIAQPHGAFNSISWTTPNRQRPYVQNQLHLPSYNIAIFGELETPQG